MPIVTIVQIELCVEMMTILLNGDDDDDDGDDNDNDDDDEDDNDKSVLTEDVNLDTGGESWDKVAVEGRARYNGALDFDLDKVVRNDSLMIKIPFIGWLT